MSSLEQYTADLLLLDACKAITGSDCETARRVGLKSQSAIPKYRNGTRQMRDDLRRQMQRIVHEAAHPSQIA